MIMDSKKIGATILVLSVIMAAIFIVFSYKVINQIKDQVVYDESGNCIHENLQTCPFQQINRFTPPIYFGSVVLILLAALGVYLAFFEGKSNSKSEESKKSDRMTEKENAEKENFKKENDEKFRILMMGMDESEQKVIMAVKEQDGISQSTLMLRVDMSKTKLSLVLKGLESKGLIKKVEKGKINLIYLKKAI